MSQATTNSPATPSTGRKRRNKLLKRSVIGLIILGILTAIGLAFRQIALGPSEGTVVSTLPDNIQARAAPELEQLDGTYISFAYPDSYTAQPSSDDTATALETHTLVATGMMNKLLTVTVTKLPTGRLEDNASYYMRSTHPETYQMKPQVIRGEKVVVMVNMKDAQEAAFWVHNGKLLTFALSSVSINSEATAAEYQTMLESVKWL